MKKSTIQVIQAPPLLLRREDAAAAMGVSVSLFEREVQRGKYPKPRLLANRSTGWLYAELVACAQALPVSDLLPVPPRKPAAQDGQTAA